MQVSGIHLFLVTSFSRKLPTLCHNMYCESTYCELFLQMQSTLFLTGIAFEK